MRCKYPERQTNRNMKDFISNPFTLIHPGERPTMQSWVNFAMTALMAVGTGLLLSGIIFFFAYNWADLHHLTKLGIIVTAIAALAIGACLCRKNRLAQQMLLLGASVMVGVLMAVYGQSYQMQADSGFLVWALFILLWAIVADFDPLWLIFAIVLQVDVYYAFENNRLWYHEFTMSYISALGLIALAALLPHLYSKIRERSKWFMDTLFAMAAIVTVIQLVLNYDIIGNLFFLLPFMAVAGLYGYWKRSLSVMSMGCLVLLIDINILMFEHLKGVVAIPCIASLAAYVWVIKWLKNEWNHPTPKTTDDGTTE